MADAFDRIVIAVPDLHAAVGEYATLLGKNADPVDATRAWFVLPNTTIELCQQTPAGADASNAGSHISGLVLRDASAGEAVVPVPNALDIAVGICDGSATARLRGAPSSDLSVDHLVLRTDSAESCVNLFNVELDVRLALDKTVPEWGGRMLFFRAGKMTLEVIEALDRSGDSPGNRSADSGKGDAATGSSFWGIAYQHPDLATACAEAAARGVSCSSLRDGRKPGTRVATVKSHSLGIPTLLIQPSG